ncbi:restriction system modified-DNA reader domain-containing protein [Streptomyces poonensis]|uniref:restriction system modified-DNA reader domain-containing protein n=1 Tax=Streptomyces poonensis TaxID=68255 RepID=UPI003570DB9C
MVIRISIPDATIETRTVGDDVHIDITPRGGPEGAGNAATQTTPGGLAPMIEAGDLEVGEALYWSRPRLGVRHEAQVLPNGWLSFEGKPYRTPSGAAVAAAGSQADGWTAWRRERDGVIIGSLRKVH